MSTWRDKLRPTWSLGGVTVWWTEDDLTTGHRVVEHAYPRQDVLGIEAMGKAPRRFTLSGVLLGEDWMDQRDKLVAVCEGAPPVKLVHPHFGEIQVAIPADGLNLRYSTRDGGMVTVRLTCVRHEEKTISSQPKAKVATAKAARQLSVDLATTVEGAIEQALDLAGSPSWVKDAAAIAIDAIQALPTWDITKLSAADLVAAGSGAVARGLGSLIENIDGIDALPLARQALTLATRAVELVPPALVGGTSNRTLALTNTAVLARGLQGLALSAAAEAAARALPESAQAAEALMTSVSEALTEAMWDADDDVYQAMASARAAVVTHLTETATGLPQRTQWTPSAPTPVMAAAHDLYGDDPAMVLRGIEDLAARNGLRHPLFPDTGEALEVLSHV